MPPAAGTGWRVQDSFSVAGIARRGSALDAARLLRGTVAAVDGGGDDGGPTAVASRKAGPAFAASRVFTGAQGSAFAFNILRAELEVPGLAQQTANSDTPQLALQNVTFWSGGSYEAAAPVIAQALAAARRGEAEFMATGARGARPAVRPEGEEGGLPVWAVAVIAAVAGVALLARAPLLVYHPCAFWLPVHHAY